jgi:hypothetical protein
MKTHSEQTKEFPSRSLKTELCLINHKFPRDDVGFADGCRLPLEWGHQRPDAQTNIFNSLLSLPPPFQIAAIAISAG